MEKKTLRELILRDFRSADVFAKYQLNDFCSHNLPLDMICEKEHLDVNKVIAEILTATRDVKMPSELGFESWALDFLVDYIVNVHHAYLFKTIPTLETELHNYIRDHPGLSPEILATIRLCEKLGSLIVTQNITEEKVIFPYIRQLHSAFSQRESYGMLFVKTLGKPFTDMEKSRKLTRELMSELDEMSAHFMFTEKTCTKYKVLIQKMQQMHHVLAEHLRIEDGYLFPRAIEVERKLLEL